MNNIQVNFDFNKNVAIIKYLGSVIKKNISVIEINNYTKMASIDYKFNSQHKWVFNWLVWAEREQFLEFSEYKKQSEYTKDPWRTLAKWSYIRNPQIGTVQTSDVHRMIYKEYLFPDVGEIIFKIEGTIYGDWNNNNFVEGYYY